MQAALVAAPLPRTEFLSMRCAKGWTRFRTLAVLAILKLDLGYA
ncbi:hypothetical protein IFHNHDMJ_00227 [Synechococcus sp. CBW1107]|jgi:hypothetical protein|nr:hypothetical protein IFHNHDMJ_00227 [Synechococcus sp. CBW1107]